MPQVSVSRFAVGHSAWDFGKLLCLKLVNIIVLYIVKRYVQLTKDADCGTVAPELCKCPLESMGYQFLFLILTDLLVGAVAVLQWYYRPPLHHPQKLARSRTCPQGTPTAE